MGELALWLKYVKGKFELQLGVGGQEVTQQPRCAEQKASYCGMHSRGCSRLPSTHPISGVPFQTGPALPGLPALVGFLMNGWAGSRPSGTLGSACLTEATEASNVRQLG